MSSDKALKELFPNIEKHVQTQLEGTVYVDPRFEKEEMNPFLVFVIVFGFGFFLMAMLMVNAVLLTSDLICK